ncbi:MAG: hypothetical protein A2293_13970 [Elusimicrobia bacterium RIFOXYB2_FULL_49_7]|nr:MAG: hypothetical protein A2293_13970 [Elusimicrobia bacterium RIFOXYB2_FULL_49_7]
MTFLSFFFREIRYRLRGYIINVLVVLLSVASVVFIRQISESSIRSIQLITKSMGQNMVLIHEDTRLEDYYTASGKELDLPQAYVDTLIRTGKVDATYHVAILQIRRSFMGTDVILTGAASVKGGKEEGGKKNPFPEMRPGEIRIGKEISQSTGLLAGDTALLLGDSVLVTGVEEEKGTMDDYRVYMDLATLQSKSGRPGKITSILSLECLCAGEPLSITESRIRQAVRSVLPEVKVITLRNIAIARYQARETTEKYGRIILVLILVSTLLFIAVQSYSEATQKEKESALMSAIGFSGWTTVFLYILKAFWVSIPAVLSGFFLGQFLSVRVGPLLAKAKVVSNYGDLALYFPAAFGVVLIGFLPAVIRALRSDPFDILREE